MKKTAILVDGEWFRRMLDMSLGKSLVHGVTADVMYRNSLAALEPKEEELFRLFYYDCPPYAGRETNPIDKTIVDFKTHAKYQPRNLFLSEMRTKDYVAMRLGVAKGRGWTLRESFIKQAISGSNAVPPQARDVFFSLEQKGVDMRIGIDVATLALKRIVDRVILISGDTDMIPAMKLARREGVQVIMVEIDSASVKPLVDHIDEDSDLIRCIKPMV